jgi:hypothetical protein
VNPPSPAVVVSDDNAPQSMAFCWLEVTVTHIISVINPGFVGILL